jgi:hypothetical protein
MVCVCVAESFNLIWVSFNVIICISLAQLGSPMRLTCSGLPWMTRSKSSFSFTAKDCFLILFASSGECATWMRRPSGLKNCLNLFPLCPCKCGWWWACCVVAALAGVSLPPSSVCGVSDMFALCSQRLQRKSRGVLGKITIHGILGNISDRHAWTSIRLGPRCAAPKGVVAYSSFRLTRI